MLKVFFVAIRMFLNVIASTYISGFSFLTFFNLSKTKKFHAKIRKSNSFLVGIFQTLKFLEWLALERL